MNCYKCGKPGTAICDRCNRWVCRVHRDCKGMISDTYYRCNTVDHCKPACDETDYDRLGEAVNVIASLMDALDGHYTEPEASAKLRTKAEDFRKKHWQARKDWWKKQ